MKKILMIVLLCSVGLLKAAELEVAQPTVNLKQAWSTGKLTGKNYTDGTIGMKDYPNVWSYWFIKSGTTPSNFELAPLNAIPHDGKAAQKWKDNTILAAEANGDSFRFPALLNGSFVVRDTKHNLGGAYAFTNPFAEKVKVIVEGNFNHLKGANVFLFVKTRDGGITIIGDNRNPDCLHQVSNTFPNGSVRTRSYMKLQLEQVLNPGDSLFFAVRDPTAVAGKYSGPLKTIFFINDNWGKTWNPIIHIEKD